MNISTSELAHRRNKFLPGTRVRLLKMSDKQAPPAGTVGTVKIVDDAGSVHINWDNGSSLSLLPHMDEYEILSVPVMQQCECCGKEFPLIYFPNGKYEYDPKNDGCDCSSEFFPVGLNPSIAQWMEFIKPRIPVPKSAASVVTYDKWGSGDLPEVKLFPEESSAMTYMQDYFQRLVNEAAEEMKNPNSGIKDIDTVRGYDRLTLIKIREDGTVHATSVAFVNKIEVAET